MKTTDELLAVLCHGDLTDRQYGMIADGLRECDAKISELEERLPRHPDGDRAPKAKQ